MLPKSRKKKNEIGSLIQFLNDIWLREDEIRMIKKFYALRRIEMKRKLGLVWKS